MSLCAAAMICSVAADISALLWHCRGSFVLRSIDKRFSGSSLRGFVLFLRGRSRILRYLLRCLTHDFPAEINSWIPVNFSLCRRPKGGIWMTHVSMLPAKTLFIMLPWGHTEMMTCFSSKVGGGIECFCGHLALMAVANLSNFSLWHRQKSVYG